MLPCEQCGNDTTPERADCSFALPSGRFVRVHSKCRESAERKHYPHRYGPCAQCGADERLFYLDGAPLPFQPQIPGMCFVHYRERKTLAESAAATETEARWRAEAQALQTRTEPGRVVAWGPSADVSAWAAEHREYADGPAGRAYSVSVREWIERGVAHAAMHSSASCE